jgi:hypothetical protein
MPFLAQLSRFCAGMMVLSLLLVRATGASAPRTGQISPALAVPKLLRGPYLQLNTPSSIIVRWRTEEPCSSVVRYGFAPNAMPFAEVATGRTKEHVVLLSGLTPNTRYFYAIGTTNWILAGRDVNHFFVTAPPAGTARPTRIWVLGDSGTRNWDARAVRDGYYRFSSLRATDLWLMLGDNAYRHGTDEQYQGALFNMYPEMLRKAVLWPTLGNHDAINANSTNQSGVYYDIFTLPTLAQAGGVPSGTEAYYSFDHGNIHFVCLDSLGSDRSPNGSMLSWFKRDLAANRRDWTIAYWHHPPYSKGSHDSDNDGESGGILKEMREHVLPIAEAGGVDLVLSGHSHSYERSFLLDRHYGKSITLSPAMKRNAGDGRVRGHGPYLKPSAGPGPHEGTVYVVAGSSGQTSGGKLNHPAMYISLNSLGSLVLDINLRRLDATFIDHTGTPRDAFTIIKGVPIH